jgi:hypothetical protein
MPFNQEHLDYIGREHAFRRGYIRGVHAILAAAGERLTEAEREKVQGWLESLVTPWPAERGAAFQAPPFPEL